MPLTQEEHEGGNSRTASSTEIDVGATPERVEREVVTSKEPAIVAQAPTLYTADGKNSDQRQSVQHQRMKR